MELLLFKMPPIRGTYDINRNNVSDDYLPRRMLYMHPDAAKSFLAFDRTIVLSDLFRSAEASLAARKRKRGVQQPAYSGHNFGLSFDVDIRRTLHENVWTYPDLLRYLLIRKWYCYRRDGKRGREDWHFNFLGPDPTSILNHIDPRPWRGRRTWKRGAEMAIQKRYHGQFNLDPSRIQMCLHKLGLYSGDIDGALGPISKQAVRLFAKTWGLKRKTSHPRFQRVLSYVAAEKRIITDLAAAPPIS